MRRCWNHRRRRCRRPPLCVHVGDQPFQVKQLAYESGDNDWTCHPWEEDDWACCSQMSFPGFEEEDFLPPFPPPPPGTGIGAEETGTAFESDAWMMLQDGMDDFSRAEDEDETTERFRPPHPDLEWPPHHWLPRPRNCNGCNLKIKVFKYDACRRPKENVVIGLYVRGRLVRTEETNERGEAVFSYLHPGLYTVRELEVPEGVEEDTTRFAVYLSHACTSAIVVFRKGRCRAECPRMDRWWPSNPHHQ